MYCSISGHAQIPDPKPYAETITKEKLYQHLSILASDSLEGRETGERGQKMAADYIKNNFIKNGLEAVVPSGNDKDFYQSFYLEKRSPGPTNIRLKKNRYDNFEQIVYIGNSNVKKPQKASVVFIGSGDEKALSSIDVEGKGVVFFVKSIQEYRAKVQAAEEKGATSFFIIPAKNDEDFANFNNRFKLFLSRPRLAIKKENGKDDASNVVFFVSPTFAADLFKTDIQTLIAASESQEINDIKTIGNAKLKYKAQRVVEDMITENVLGFIKGSEKPEEVLVITSHYDHLGIRNGEVFNGADDDASGTTGLLAVMEAFSEAKRNGIQPKRSILFMTVTGEEKGLLGSEYYTEHPIFPLENTVTNLNVDMIGRVDDAHSSEREYVYLIGSDKLSQELHDLSETINDNTTGLFLDYTYNDENDPNRYYYRSDHYNFAKNNVPVIFYFNGTHKDYHQSTDTIEKIQLDVMEKRARLIFYTAWELAQRDERVLLK